MPAAAGATAGSTAATPSASHTASTAALHATLSTLESRLAKIEHAVGTFEGGSAAAGGVLPQLQQLERRLGVLDDAAFNEMSRRVKLLAADAGVTITPSVGIGKGKASVASPATALRGDVTAADLRKMLDTMERWDGVASDLPAVVNRLQVRALGLQQLCVWVEGGAR